MNILLVANGIVCLFLFLFIFFKCFKNSVDISRKNTLNCFGAISFAYLILSILFFLWTFEVLKYSFGDFYLIFSAFLLVQTFFLFRFGYLINRNNKYLFLGFAYVVLVVLLFLNFELFIKFFAILSFIVMGFLFLQIFFIGREYQKLGIFGFIYSSVSIIFYIMLNFGFGNILFYFLIGGILFFLFIRTFFVDLEKYSFVKIKTKEEKSKYMIFLSHLVFIIIFINFVFIGTVAVHEFGHYGVSKFYDCDFRKIVYEDDLFHTEILCSNIEDDNFVVLGGILLPLIIALFLLFIGGTFMKEISFLMIGFNFLSLSSDIRDLGLSNNFIFLSILLGVVFFVMGIMLLVKSKTEEIMGF